MGKLKRGNWSTPDIERLRQLYPRSSEESVARLLRRSVASVQRKALTLFSRPVQSREWCYEDDLQLREGFGVVEFSALCRVLGRPARDVKKRIDLFRAQLCAGQPWRRLDLGLLKKLYGSRADQDLVVCLSRPVAEIREQAKQLCLSKDKGYRSKMVDAGTKMPRWGTDGISQLRALYSSTPNLQLAQILDRSVASVANKASQLGLRKETRVLKEMGRRNVAVRYRD